MNREKLAEEFIAICKIKEITTMSGDYKTGNKEWEKLIKIFKRFEQDHVLAEQVLLEVMSSDNVTAKNSAAACCLSLGIHLDIAENLLKEIAEKESNIWGFEAKMTLKEYYRHGYLILYQGQKIPKKEPLL